MIIYFHKHVSIFLNPFTVSVLQCINSDIKRNVGICVWSRSGQTRFKQNLYLGAHIECFKNNQDTKLKFKITLKDSTKMIMGVNDRNLGSMYTNYYKVVNSLPCTRL